MAHFKEALVSWVAWGGGLGPGPFRWLSPGRPPGPGPSAAAVSRTFHRLSESTFEDNGQPLAARVGARGHWAIPLAHIPRAAPPPKQPPSLLDQFARDGAPPVYIYP